MGLINKGISNQAMGLLPVLLFMFLDNFISYVLSFLIAVTFCLVCIVGYHILKKDKIYQLMLLPSAGTLALYSIFISAGPKGLLSVYSPVIVEILLVVTLAFVSFTKRTVLQHIRAIDSGYERTYQRTAINEFYFIAQITQSLFTLHLFAILLYIIFPAELQSLAVGRFLVRHAGIIIGICLIIYEQIRLMLVSGSLKKEMWLPVVSDKGQVIGCMARSVSRALPKRYCHPVVRIAVVYQGMLYLTKRNPDEFVSPDTYDYPFHSYVLFHHDLKQTIAHCLGPLMNDKHIAPRFLIHYVMENEKVKHFVSLYVIHLQNEEQLKKCTQPNGKLWSVRQIEDNMNQNIFSEYLTKEFTYLKNTILLADHLYCEMYKPKSIFEEEEEQAPGRTASVQKDEKENGQEGAVILKKI